MVLVLVKKNQRMTTGAIVAALRDQPASRLRELLLQLRGQLEESEKPLRDEVDQLLDDHAGLECPPARWKEKAAVFLAGNGSFVDVNALGNF